MAVAVGVKPAGRALACSKTGVALYVWAAGNSGRNVGTWAGGSAPLRRKDSACGLWRLRMGYCGSACVHSEGSGAEA